MTAAPLLLPAAVPAAALTAAAFAPYGEVIERSGSDRPRPINGGTCLRHHDLARPVALAPGAVAFSLFEADATPLPTRLRELERHHRGSQTFAPFGDALPMLVVVAPAQLAAHELCPERLAVFVTNGRQGVHLRPGTWHHPLLSLQAGCWLVADRIGDVDDCEVVPIADWGLHVVSGADHATARATFTG